jgi:hypothetical protein
MGFGVHFLSKKFPRNKYSIFGALLMVMVVPPTTPLQMILRSKRRPRWRRIVTWRAFARWCWLFLLWLARR